ncbi:hypothetical protein [Thermonema rossianum]|uniref:hypothetical protein n=1 Tax=Thermonema rossianum TaxID=55505 RepID=UPI000571C29E|nr:hypothetical protein [Thermonema rossianum]
MYKGYKVVCLTPAGRRRYMKLLAPYILKAIQEKYVDEWQILVNTTNPDDILFFERLRENFNNIKLIPQPDGIIDGNRSINAFFRYFTDEKTIYIRLDDDVVWIEDNFFKKFLDFRIENPQYFLVFPLIINNAVCTHILQQENKILKDGPYIRALASDKNGWENPLLAEKIHRWFIKSVLNGTYKNLYFDYVPVSLNRVSINCIGFLGEHFKLFNGNVVGDEEEDLTVHKPRQLKLVNCIFGGALISHFAFYTQRSHLDKTNILNEYEKLLLESKNSFIKETYLIINKLLNIEHSSQANLNKYINPQKQFIHNNIAYVKKKVGDIKVPWIVLKSLREIKNLYWNKM